MATPRPPNDPPRSPAAAGLHQSAVSVGVPPLHGLEQPWKEPRHSDSALTDAGKGNSVLQFDLGSKSQGVVGRDAGPVNRVDTRRHFVTGVASRQTKTKTLMSGEVPLFDGIREMCEIRKRTGELRSDDARVLVKRAIAKADTQNPVLALVPRSDAVALDDFSGRQPLTFKEWHSHLTGDLLKLGSSYGISPSTRVGLLMPQGCEAATLLASVMSQAVAAPINFNSTYEEITHEAKSFGIDVLILSSEDKRLAELCAWCRQEEVGVLAAASDEDQVGLVYVEEVIPMKGREAYRSPQTGLGGALSHLARSLFHKSRGPSRAGLGEETRRSHRAAGSACQSRRMQRSQVQFPEGIPENEDERGEDECSLSSLDEIELQDFGRESLLMHTSGSTGNKKVVVHSLENVVLGPVIIAASGDLRPGDVCANMMPLFHAGGIFRTVMGPLFSGSCTLHFPSFDPNMFVESLTMGDRAPTWYYGAPTLHTGFLDALQAGGHIDEETGRCSLAAGVIRMINNAAGPLHHSLALRMKDAYPNTSIMPCYGLSESMPVTAPPVGYRLERPGTSGQLLGPDICIGELVGEGPGRVEAKETGETGRIFVRGAPVMKGYEIPDLAAGTRTFNTGRTLDGWLDTGDMGRLDSEGFLFITGRSKEIINRGGETLVPNEIEAALLSCPGIKALCVFAAPHEELQETVGVAVVSSDVPSSADKEGDPSPPPPIGLKEIRKFAAQVLHPTKWPYVLVHVSELPKNASNKLVRIGLASKISLPKVKEGTPPTQREFILVPRPPPEAPSPPPSKNPLSGHWTVGALPQEWVDAMNARGGKEEEGDGNLGETEKKVGMLWAELLGTEMKEGEVPFRPSDDFFEVGGSSLVAGQLAALLRKEFGVAVTGMAIFDKRSLRKMSALMEELRHTTAADQGGNGGGLERKGTHRSRTGGQSRRANQKYLFQKQYSQAESVFSSGDEELDVEKGEQGGETTRRKRRQQRRASGAEKVNSRSCLPMTVQLLPWLFFSPLRKVLSWILFLYMWVTANRLFSSFRFSSVLFAIVTSYAIRSIAFPLFGILFKHVVLGRLKEGRHPLWGGVYLRWYLTDRVLSIFGKGIFAASDPLYSLYLRLLGANVGKGCSISPYAKVGEHDLLEFRDGCKVDSSAYCRAGVADRGTFFCAPIEVGKRAFVCHNGVLNPSCKVLRRGTVAPNSAAREGTTWDPDLRAACQAAPDPLNFLLRWLFGMPLVMLINALSRAPALAVFLGVFLEAADFTSFSGAVGFFSGWEKICYMLLVRAVYAVVTPSVFILAVILVKRLIVGRFAEGARGKSQWQRFRRWIMKTLLPNGKLGGFLPVFGAHWNLHSWVLRALGAKVGKRVFLPGSGLRTFEHDLLEIGDDVVFGSRSYFITTDTKEAQKIRLIEGCTVSDRCVLLPGVTVHRNAVMGSGCLAPKGFEVPEESVWIGNRQGRPLCLGEGKPGSGAPTLKPFGKAQYGEASGAGGCGSAFACCAPRSSALPYVLPGPFAWGLWCMLSCIFVFWWRLLPLLASVVAVKFLFLDQAEGTEGVNDGTVILGLIVAYLGASLVSRLIALGADVSLKWMILGKVSPGNYDWDKKSYNRNWKLHTQFVKLRGVHEVDDYLGGSEYICMFFRFLGARIGKNVCLYPVGSDPMMTEPDLVTIEDGACVNHAFVVCHLNSRGRFDLDRVRIGPNATMRAHSRVMAGAVLEEGAVLLERTLAPAGETVDAGAVKQGWPIGM